MDDLFRLPGAAEHDPRVEAWFGLTDPFRLMVRDWFQRMRDLGPDVREVLHDGCPTACIGDAAFAYVNAFKAHAAVGFFQGSALPDPGGLLEGEGRRMRHVKLRPGRPVDAEALAKLIAAAGEDMRLRLARPGDS